MRLLGKVYFDPQSKTEEQVIFESQDDGQDRRPIKGDAPPSGAIRRVPVHIEVICDPGSIDQTLEMLGQIESELKSKSKSKSKGKARLK